MHEIIPRAELEAACSFIRQCGCPRPRVGLITGSGLAGLAEEVRGQGELPYAEIPGFPRPAVPGHLGRLIWGSLGATPVSVLQGRVHFYEGISIQRAVFPVRVLARLGMEILVVTNAAGGLSRALRAGDLMLIRDHISLPGMAGLNPLWGPNDDELGPRFVDMRQAYDAQLRALASEVARELGIPLKEGVYIWLAGPSFETPADIRALRSWGADAVGMSTVPEVTAARHMGVRVVGISHISNLALEKGEPTAELHQEVLAAGGQTLPRLRSLLLELIARL